MVLDEGEKLSDGARVEVGGVEEHLSAEEAIRRILGNPITKPLGMLEILREDQREQEERFDQWMKPEPD
ncbi:MAG: hypothetical protein DFNUSKGM_000230 [Candidatus Fervidibacter sacchari]